MKVYLVINDGHLSDLSYKDKYRIFKDRKIALDHAVSLGYRDTFGMGTSDQVGILSMYCRGVETNVKFLPVEIEE